MHTKPLEEVTSNLEIIETPHWDTNNSYIKAQNSLNSRATPPPPTPPKHHDTKKPKHSGVLRVTRCALELSPKKLRAVWSEDKRAEQILLIP